MRAFSVTFMGKSNGVFGENMDVFRRCEIGCKQLYMWLL